MNIYYVALIPFRSHMVSAEFDFTFSNIWFGPTNFADNFSNMPTHTDTERKHRVCKTSHTSKSLILFWDLYLYFVFEFCSPFCTFSLYSRILTQVVVKMQWPHSSRFSRVILQCINCHFFHSSWKLIVDKPWIQNTCLNTDKATDTETGPVTCIMTNGNRQQKHFGCYNSFFIHIYIYACIAIFCWNRS